MKKILASVFMVALVSITTVAATRAYFSDTETSVSNTFSAGTLDMKLKDADEDWRDGVTATWNSPSNWKPGDTLTATLSATNIGTIDSHHIYFMFSNTHDGNGDSSNLLDAIIITSLTERFNSSVTTPNQVARLATLVGDHVAPLTLNEFVSWANGWYGWYTFDDQTEDGIVLEAGDIKDYDFILSLEFASGSGNEYQGDTCSFDMTWNATQDSPVDGLISLH